MDRGVILDLDGTLVDSVYLHVVAWHEAFREHGDDVPTWRIHTGIGMGGERIVPWLLGGPVAEDHAEALRSAHAERFLARAELLGPTDGARELLDDLREREVPHLIATSAGSSTRDALLSCLGEPVPPMTDQDGVERSKPAPDVVLAAASQLGIDPTACTMVGDAPWDAEAARAAGAAAIGVRCGGFPPADLREAGARRVVDTPRDLVGAL